jgi:hypothetical protein
MTSVANDGNPDSDDIFGDTVGRICGGWGDVGDLSGGSISSSRRSPGEKSIIA